MGSDEQSSSSPDAILTEPSGVPRPRGAAAARVRQVKDWVRAAVPLPDDAAVVVSELACSEPGCPPYEVVMAILVSGQPPRQRKVHRRLGDLAEDDVRALWSRPDDPAPHDDRAHQPEE